ncbi:uncharacterized protein MYCFIDRAFT_55512 [Pseudocercospora fijiensis CIRAD86]|uniref:Uncharacterized protein n=1 Tax=Pseudocercospora fijiensis (strain CIRAD86) TaxID=383855 RepID=N1QAQ6_PSEFD|nr:uncharacterized protein MYCFIDRAFT_55512 [Pseudocercospora fijiensis CIRAD86]EME89006.1 hypothetical protein MYCFIDRAFT_55512 [Pseudocercospora fijiensis CIRAD86]
MAGVLQTPDRFIPPRWNTPTKESFLLGKAISKRPVLSSASSTLSRRDTDPFGPIPSQSVRTNDRFATTRRLPPDRRPINTVGSQLTPGGLGSNRRAISTGAVWSVGSTIVTEGVASITDGRGGRVTSGTSAPHHTSDFLRRQSPSEEETVHSQRLAVAMQIDEHMRLSGSLNTPSTSSQAGSSSRRSCSDSSGNRTVWSNNAWEKEMPSTPSRAPKRKSKHIPIIPFRVLDAPALRDDYYCSLLAYSHTMQCLAVGLGPHVYLWSESRGTSPSHVPDSLTSPFGAHVTSVTFSSEEGDCAILAVGRADGRVTLWSPRDQEARFNSEQPAPISCVCFKPTSTKRPSIREPTEMVLTEELLVGDEMGNVYYYSVEWPSQDKRDLFDWHGSMTLLARISCHSQQVCGMAWSRDGEYFATGGNDNQLFLFETRKIFCRSRRRSIDSSSAMSVRNGNPSGDSAIPGQGEVLAITPGQEKHLFSLNAAVKAIAFAPWQSSLIAAGGGSNDRCIHFFHALSGACLATIDCHAQITSLVWSEKRKEIAATFGFAQPEHPYRVAVFTWPSCRRVVGIPW